MSCYQEEEEEKEGCAVSSSKSSGGERWWSYQMEMESVPPGSDLETNINDQSVLPSAKREESVGVRGSEPAAGGATAG